MKLEPEEPLAAGLFAALMVGFLLYCVFLLVRLLEILGI